MLFTLKQLVNNVQYKGFKNRKLKTSNIEIGVRISSAAQKQKSCEIRKFTLGFSFCKQFR